MRMPRNAYSSDEEYEAALRDWFAGQALAGMLSGKANIFAHSELSDLAFDFADAMLEARKTR